MSHYTNPGNNNIVRTFKIEVTLFIYPILNRVKFTRITKVPNICQREFIYKV